MLEPTFSNLVWEAHSDAELDWNLPHNQCAQQNSHHLDVYFWVLCICCSPTPPRTHFGACSRKREKSRMIHQRAAIYVTRLYLGQITSSARSERRTSVLYSRDGAFLPNLALPSLMNSVLTFSSINSRHI